MRIFKLPRAWSLIYIYLVQKRDPAIELGKFLHHRQAVIVTRNGSEILDVAAAGLLSWVVWRKKAYANGGEGEEKGRRARQRQLTWAGGERGQRLKQPRGMWGSYFPTGTQCLHTSFCSFFFFLLSFAPHLPPSLPFDLDECAGVGDCLFRFFLFIITFCVCKTQDAWCTDI
jgi:hypothetical protein